MATDIKPAKIELDPAQLEKLQSIYDAVAAIPDEELRRKYPNEYKAMIDDGNTDPTALAMMRYQLSTLLIQAWVNEYMRGYMQRLAAAIVMGMIKVIRGLIGVIDHHDQRLDSLERWRLVALLEMSQHVSLSQRIKQLEDAAAAEPAIVGPSMGVATTGTATAELFRYRPDQNVIGNQQRLFRIKAENATGSALYETLWYDNAVVVGGAVQSLAGDTVGLVTSGGSITTAVSGDTKEVIFTANGQLGQSLNWHGYEVATDVRPNPNQAPIFRPAAA